MHKKKKLYPFRIQPAPADKAAENENSYPHGRSFWYNTKNEIQI